MTSVELLCYLEECRDLAIQEIRRLIPSKQQGGAALYELILDYPLREAKGLRPALCIASCRALGGKLDAVARSSAVLELFHNAFLIHDDIEDGSLMRRGRPTLHREYGVPIAVNVGDAMFSLSLQPLLDNIAVIGLGPALRVLQAIAQMTRQSVEGQGLELDWIRRQVWDLSDDHYVRMVEQKTGWYSFITPVIVGAIAAQASQEQIDQLAGFARSLSIAFQIQDDVLNLRGEVGAYGKEIGGDLWEGKRTLILLHMMRSATVEERARAERILALPRPSQPSDEDRAPSARLDALRPVKAIEDVSYLSMLIARYRSIDHAKQVARSWAEDAERRLGACHAWLRPSIHGDVLTALVDYVLSRGR